MKSHSMKKKSGPSFPRPLGNKITIKPMAGSTKTDGGLFLPEVRTSERFEPQLGEVVAVGFKVKDIRVGDTVIYNRHRGVDFEFGGVMMKQLPDEDPYVCFPGGAKGPVQASIRETDTVKRALGKT